MVDDYRLHPLDVYLDTVYAGLRMIESGVTLVIHSGYTRERGRIEEETRAALRAYSDTGLRVAYAVGIDDRNTFVFQDNDVLFHSLPGPLAERGGRLVDRGDEAFVDRHFVADGRSSLAIRPRSAHFGYVRSTWTRVVLRPIA